MLIGGDRPDTSIINTINLFRDDDAKKILNPIYGFLWANCNIINNYYNFSPKNNVLGNLIRLLFTKNPLTGEITPSRSLLVPEFLRFNNTTSNKPKLLGVIIGLLYQHLQSIISKSINNNKQNVPMHNNANNMATKKTKKLRQNMTKKMRGPTYLKISILSNISGINNESKKTEELKQINEKIAEFNDKVLRKYVPINADEKTIKDTINILLALMWWNADNKDGIKEYYMGIKLVLVEEEINTDDLDNTYLGSTYFSNNIQKIYKGLVKSIKLFDTGTAINDYVVAKLKKDKTQDNGFSDCGETVIRNIINICCANEAGEFNIDILDKLGAIAGVKEYYTKYKNIILQNSQTARNAWALLVSNLEDVKYSDANINGYKFDLDSGLAEKKNNNKNNKTSKPNLLVAISKILTNINDWKDFGDIITINGENSLSKGLGTLTIKKNDNTYKVSLSKGHFHMYVEGEITLFNMESYIRSADEQDKLYMYGLLTHKYNTETCNYFEKNESWVYYINNINVEKFKVILEYFYNIGKKLSLNIPLLNNVTRSNSKLNSLAKKQLSNIELFANIYICLLNYFNYFEGDIYKRVKLLSMFLIKYATLLPEIQMLKSTLLLYGIKINDDSIISYDEIESIEVTRSSHFNDEPLPKKLKYFFDNSDCMFEMKGPLTTGFFPSSIVSIKFSNYFNNDRKPLGKGVLPDSLQSIIFGDSFTNGGTALKEDVLPASLQSLTFGANFTNGGTDLKEDVLPASLQSLTFGANFTNGDTALKRYVLPASLQSLTFGANFTNGDTALQQDVLPASLQSLTFGANFTNGNYTLQPGVLPASLQSLTFGANFTNGGYTLQPGVLPASLQSLTFGANFTNGSNPLCVANIIPNLIPNTIIQKTEC